MSDKTTNGERCHQAHFINYQIGGDREIRKVKPARGSTSADLVQGAFSPVETKSTIPRRKETKPNLLGLSLILTFFHRERKLNGTEK